MDKKTKKKKGKKDVFKGLNKGEVVFVFGKDKDKIDLCEYPIILQTLILQLLIIGAIGKIALHNVNTYGQTRRRT